MTIKINRWSPDTCGCVLEYSWDDSVPPNAIVVSPTTVVKKCEAHTSLTTTQNVYSILTEENPRKNNAYQHILDNGPTSLSDLVNGTRQIKPGIDIVWTWTGIVPNRILNLTITGVTLTGTQRTSIQNQLNTRFGAGKVILV